MKFIDYFLLLEVHLTASDEIIKVAYKKLAQRYHPDNNGDVKKMKLLATAYDTLSNHDKKKRYIIEYLKHYGLDVPGIDLGWERSMYDFSILPLRRLVLEYLFFIKNSAYNDAYDMLSKYNKKHIFKKEFCEWQGLVSRFHRLLEFDCTYLNGGIISFSDSKYLQGKPFVEFRVKVVEINLLLNKKEEDIFNRMIVLDDEAWGILLKQDQLKPIIKKYKRLHQVYMKKNHPKLLNRNNGDYYYATGYVTKRTFLENCEHEQIRFMRYHNKYSIVAFLIGDKNLITHIRTVLENNTRMLDCITYIERGYFLILLPETDEEKSIVVCKKLYHICLEQIGENAITTYKSLTQKFDSVKELLGEVLK